MNIKEKIEQDAHNYGNPRAYLSRVIFEGSRDISQEFAESSKVVRFYNENKNEINRRLSDFLSTQDVESPAELFGEDWNVTDSQALQSHNKSLLAWFAYERAAAELLEGGI